MILTKEQFKSKLDNANSEAEILNIVIEVLKASMTNIEEAEILEIISEKDSTIFKEKLTKLLISKLDSTEAEIYEVFESIFK